MRWFCGFIGKSQSSLNDFPKPQEARNIWEYFNPLWVCGAWAESELILINEDSINLAILGKCLAPKIRVIELFRSSIKDKNYSNLTQLPGNYNIVVNDKDDTYIFTDLAGLRPVFYATYRSFIIYSSLSVSVKQLIGAEINYHWLALSLICPGTVEMTQNISPFFKVHTVPPGHFLKISSEQISCKKYWGGIKEQSDLSKAVQRFREQLITAVELRVSSYANITSDLSGGMDSTSLAILAAKRLAVQGRDLHTITLGSTSSNEYEDVSYARHAASFFPNITPLILESHEFPTPFSNLDQIPLTDAPASIVNTIARFQYVMKIIKSKGSQLHFSGEGGDAVLLAPYSYLADLILRFQIGRFIQHSYGWARVWGLSPTAILSSAVVLSATSYCHWLSQQAQQLTSNIKPNQQILGWSIPPSSASWYTREAIEMAATDMQEYATTALPFGVYPGQHSSIVGIYLMGQFARVEQQMGETCGVNLDFPYLDSLVVDASLQTRAEERTNPFIFKPLLQKALIHEVPKSILNRNTKGRYTAEVFKGIQQNIDVIKQLFQTSQLADIGLIDSRKFYAAIEQLALGLQIETGAFSTTIAVEFWLRRVRENRHKFWLTK